MHYRKAINIFDLQEIARRRLPRGVYGFIAGGVENDQTLRNNRDVFERIRFRPRSPIDISGRSSETTIFGRTFAAPFGIAPMGIAGIASYKADIALARGAARMKVPFTLSNVSTVPMEAVAQSADHARWLQAYLTGDRDSARRFVERADAAGYEILMVTTDVAVNANREINLRTGFSLPLKLTPKLAYDGLSHPRWLASVLARTLLNGGVPRMENTDRGDRPSMLATSDASRNMRGGRETVSWDLIRHVRDHWNKPLLVKGILHPADAQLALRYGLDGVVVSNHGGRQLDGSISPLEALPDIRAAVGDKLKLICDSGFRRGTDIVKALALGADFVMCGRAMLFGAAAGGEDGVAHAIRLLQNEIDKDIAQLGINRIDELSLDCLDLRDFGWQPAGQTEGAAPAVRLRA